MSAGVRARLTRASSAAVARSGTGATAARAMRARAQVPLDIVSSEATPTTAMSSSRRGVWRAYVPPVRAAGAGITSSTSSSPGARTVRRTPWKNDPIGMRRRPAGPATTASASSARSGGAMSADGAAVPGVAPAGGEVPDLQRPDQGGALGETRVARAPGRVHLELARGHRRADAEPAAVLAHRAELGDAREIHHAGGLEEAVLELGEQVGA